MLNEQIDATNSGAEDERDSPPVVAILSSQPLSWDGIVVEQLTYNTTQFEWTSQPDHILTVHIAEPTSLVQKRDGQTQRGGLITGDFTLTPAGSPSAWYWDKPLDKLHLRLAPSFVRKVAAECDLDPERVELLHNFGTHDPQIERISLALKAELQTEGLGGRLFSESLATALTVQLLRHYCSTGHHAAVCAGVTSGSVVAIVGDGAVGLCGVLAARRLGASRILILGHQPDRLALAQRFGATDLISARGDEAIQQVQELTSGGAIAVLECVGSTDSLRTAIAIARAGGQIGYVGVPHHAEPLDMQPMFLKNIGLRGGVAPVRTYLPDLLSDTLAGKIQNWQAYGFR